MTTKVSASVKGIATVGMIVSVRRPRKRPTTPITRMNAMTRVSLTSSIDSTIGSDWSKRISSLMLEGSSWVMPRRRALIRSAMATVFLPGSR